MYDNRARRVKCDETKQACIKCQRSGRVCDGYPALDERWKPENHMIAVSAFGMSANNEVALQIIFPCLICKLMSSSVAIPVHIP